MNSSTITLYINNGIAEPQKSKTNTSFFSIAMKDKTEIETIILDDSALKNDFLRATTNVSVTINNTKGSFGCFHMNVEPTKIYSKEYTEKIEYLYQERLKDKDAMITQLQKIINQING